MQSRTAFFAFALLGLLIGTALGGGLSLRLRYDDVRAEVDKRKTELEGEWQLQTIAVAARELQPGDELDSSAIQPAEYPARFISPSFLSVEEAHDLSGTLLATDMRAGDPFMRQFVAGADGGADCAPEKLAEAYAAKVQLWEGDIVAMGDFERIKVPARLVTSSFVTELHVVEGETLRADLAMGDLLMHSHVDDCDCNCAAPCDGGEAYAEDVP